MWWCVAKSDERVRQSMLLWVGCIAGALEEGEYAAKLIRAGFSEISMEPTRVYSIEDARHFLIEAGIDVDAIAPLVEGKFMSAFIRATKPDGGCVGPAAATGLFTAAKLGAPRSVQIRIPRRYSCRNPITSLSLHRQLGAQHHGRGALQHDGRGPL